jgi:hypothetical protein
MENNPTIIHVIEVSDLQIGLCDVYEFYMAYADRETAESRAEDIRALRDADGGPMYNSVLVTSSVLH